MSEQNEIFAKLMQPFPKSDVFERPGPRGPLRYITARSVMNRLDDVVGPMNWYDTYEQLGDAIMCRLFIRIGTEWIAKSDGGAEEESKTLGGDDTAKAAFSSAFKRAAVKLGIGRYLYQEGMPEFARAYRESHK